MDVFFKNQCIALRKKGRSVNEIMRITGRAKTSIYTHIQDIPLSAERWRQIRKASGEYIRAFALARKGKSVRPFKKFTWNETTVFLVAHLLFDGEIQRTKCVYNNRSKLLLKNFEEAMRLVYDFPPSRYINRLTGVKRISYHNVALGAYMQEKSVELLASISSFAVPLKREFLRAFFDDEGCIDFRPISNRRSIRGYQKRVDVLETVKTLLLDLGIVASIKKPNEVVIVGKENLLRFEIEIGFSSGVKVNGNRSNSRWKQHLEKREILRWAIASFQS